MTSRFRGLTFLLLGFALMPAPPARAADTVSIGLVGSTGPTHWPIHIGLKKGYYAAEDIKLDLVFIQSSGAVLQQLAAGFANLGLIADYVKDLPFTAGAVNKNWAAKNPDLLRRFLAVHNKSVGFFLDRKNRQEAIDIMAEASKLKPDVIAQTYDFLHSRPFIEGTGRVSRTKMGALLAALKGVGDLQGSTEVERFVLPGVAQLSD